MEWFCSFVGVMAIIALIRVWNRPNNSNRRTMRSNEPAAHYWFTHDAVTSDGGGGYDAGSTESGGDSFDGGSSDGGGGDSSGF